MQCSSVDSTSSFPLAEFVKDTLENSGAFSHHGMTKSTALASKEQVECSHRRRDPSPAYVLEREALEAGRKPFDDVNQLQKLMMSSSMLPSSTGTAINGCETSARDTLPSNGSSTVTLSITLDRQADTDPESFRQLRACGMTLDTMSISKPRPETLCTIRAANLVVMDSDRAIEASLSSAINSIVETCSLEMEFPPTYVEKPRPRTVFEYQTSLGNLTIPLARSTPTSPVASASKGLGSPMYPLPPLVPYLDPYRRLASINKLLGIHRSLDDPRQGTGPTAVEDLIDVERLLRDNELDARMEASRRETERAETGIPDSVTPFSEQPELVQADSSWEEGIRRSPVIMVHAKDGRRVFGQPLSLTNAYASCMCSVAGYQNIIPIVVRACVEELYRTGLTVPGLFRTLPSRARHNELIELFDNGPTFGRTISLSKERTEDICALLRTYVDRLPHAIWHETLFDPMMVLCVRPSVLAENGLSEVYENQNQVELTIMGHSVARKARPISLIAPHSPLLNTVKHFHTRSPSLKDFIAMTSSLSSPVLPSLAQEDVISEKHQLSLVREFFRLLPRTELALLTYLCAFFAQLLLCPHNEVTVEDLARLFAVPIFLGSAGVGEASSVLYAARKEDARTMMVWILKRWNIISEGLFDVEDVETSYNGSEDALTNASSTDDSVSVETVASSHCRSTSRNGSNSVLQNGPFEDSRSVKGLEAIEQIPESPGLKA